MSRETNHQIFVVRALETDWAREAAEVGRSEAVRVGSRLVVVCLDGPPDAGTGRDVGRRARDAGVRSADLVGFVRVHHSPAASRVGVEERYS